MKQIEKDRHIQVMMEMYESFSPDEVTEAGYKTDIVYFKSTADPLGYGLDHLNELSECGYLEVFCWNTLYPLLDHLIDMRNTIPKEAAKYYSIYLKYLSSEFNK